MAGNVGMFEFISYLLPMVFYFNILFLYTVLEFSKLIFLFFHFFFFVNLTFVIEITV